MLNYKKDIMSYFNIEILNVFIFDQRIWFFFKNISENINSLKMWMKKI